MLTHIAGWAHRGKPLALQKHSKKSTESELIGLTQYTNLIDCTIRYVINAARAVKSKDPNHKQRLVYLSVSIHLPLQIVTN